jgi:hypothetical protein
MLQSKAYKPDKNRTYSPRPTLGVKYGIRVLSTLALHSDVTFKAPCPLNDSNMTSLDQQMAVAP